MLESKGIVHRDIKLKNFIFVAKDHTLKIANFDIAYDNNLDNMSIYIKEIDRKIHV